MKKILIAAFASALIVSTGALPAFAADKGTSTSVFVATDRHSYYDSDGYLDIAHGNYLTDILELIQSDDTITQPTVGIIGGDLVGSGKDVMLDSDGNKWAGQPAFFIDDVNDEFRTVYGNSFKTYYTFGSHDNHCASPYEDTFLSGPAKEDGYYIYGITYSQMVNATEEQAIEAVKNNEVYDTVDLGDKNGMSAEIASANFSEWVNSLDDNKPIIVMTHVPMHVHHNDNFGATTWNAALQEAAKTHDIIVLWGHNHSLETSRGDLTDRDYYLVPKGSTMEIQGFEYDGSLNEEVELAYTYCNAGYITMGYGSLLTFDDDQSDGKYDTLTINRYTLNLTLYNLTTGEVLEGCDGSGEAGLLDTFGTTGIACPYSLELTKWADIPSPEEITYNGKKQTAYEDTDAYTVSKAQGKNVGTYTATLTLKDGYKWSDGTTDSKSVEWKIVPDSTSITKVISNKKSFELKWKKNTANTTGYQIQYSQKSIFSSPKMITVKKNAKTSKKITNLKSKKTYYVRIRTYANVEGTKYVSSWSKIAKIKTK